MKNKGLLKTIIPTILISAVVATSALGLTGCNTAVDGVYTYTFVSNNYIIYNGTLHSGDVVTKSGLISEIDAATPEIQCDCGLKRTTNLFAAAEKDQKLEEGEYERVCPECLPDFEIDK